MGPCLTPTLHLPVAALHALRAGGKEEAGRGRGGLEVGAGVRRGDEDSMPRVCGSVCEGQTKGNAERSGLYNRISL